MEGTKVDAKKSGVDARLKEYEKVAKNIVGHHIWYGRKQSMQSPNMPPRSDLPFPDCRLPDQSWYVL